MADTDAFDHVLVPTDGSDGAAVAAAHALALAERYDATVHAVFVVEKYGMGTVAERTETTESGRETVDALVDRAEARGLDARGEVCDGFAHECVLDYVAAYGIDLVVMGTHGRTGLDRYLLGSVAEKVVRLSDVPVLTVREPRDGPPPTEYEDVLIPTDGSRGAQVAERTGIDVADRYGAAVHALSVVESSGLGLDVRSTQYREEHEAAARDFVEAVCERATASGVTETHDAVTAGRPARAILDYVADHDVDLVVMGTHGRTGFQRYVLGSVTEKVVRLSDVPVLTVPLPEADRD